MLLELVQKSLRDPRQAVIQQALKKLDYPQTFTELELRQTILNASLPEQRDWLLALMIALKKLELDTFDQRNTWRQRWELRDFCFTLLKRKLPFTAEDMILLAEWSETFHSYKVGAPITKACETYFKHNPAPHDPAALVAIEEMADHLNNRDDADSQRYGRKLLALLYEAGLNPGPRQISCPLDAEDAWAAAALSEIAALPLDAANAWNTLLATCAQAKTGAQAAKWLSQAWAEREAVGLPALRAALLRWFALVDTHRPVSDDGLEGVNVAYRAQYREHLRWATSDLNNDILRGLVWLTADQDDAELARAVSRLTRDAFRKIPGEGARLARVGNAGFWALGQMPGMHGVAQLAILKTRLKLPSIQKQIASAFDKTAQRLNLSPQEIEELVVPTYGLGENGQSVGARVDTFDAYQAEICILNNEPVLRWYENGKPLKAAPKTVKMTYPDEVKDLTQTVKDLRGMLTAQKERLDGLFLAQKRWPYPIWRERYLDHPLMGLLSRRLVWQFTRDGQTDSAIWLDGHLVASDDQPIDWLNETTMVELWHPLNASVEQVLAWRAWLEAHQVQQPFKQAHREVYLLTDAERITGNYSNRYAAHIIKQHQFSALCAARCWKHQLRLMVDADYPAPHRILENWGLRAEYWVESVGDNYGEDTNDSGTYHYLATDQVRFYALDARQWRVHASGGGYGENWENPSEPIPLDQVPALVFSEIMRDVDLFVGVASVGNDPTWYDGGPRGRHADYWQRYSFGMLFESAKTRREVLELLLPRLKIAPRCRLDERFLVVRGDLRTYKIHLGSGNILMEPNDQYLCIVPRSAATVGAERIFLLFEGDQTLSVILSKAFLLADDRAIKDPTITRQIDGS